MRRRILFLRGPWNQELHDVPYPLRREITVHDDRDHMARVASIGRGALGEMPEAMTCPTTTYRLARVYIGGDPIPATAYVAGDVELEFLTSRPFWHPLLDGLVGHELAVDPEELEESWTELIGPVDPYAASSLEE